AIVSRSRSADGGSVPSAAGGAARVANPLAAGGQAEVRIATRASALALWQARRVAEALARLEVSSYLVEVSTLGDEDQRPFASLAGSGFFTKAVQEAVLAGAGDIAVHSFK